MQIKINGTTYTMSDRSWELVQEGAALAEARRLEEAAGRYEIKCDDCRQTIGRTDSVRESAAGGRCDRCFEAMLSTLERAGVQAERITAMRATRAGGS